MIERQAGALLPLLHPGFAFLVQLLAFPVVVEFSDVPAV
jgi:hypothetical protein